MLYFWGGSWLQWLLFIGKAFVLIVAVILYIRARKQGAWSGFRIRMRQSIAGIALLLVFAAALKTVFQYYAFKHDAISVYLLPPHQSWEYFLGYAGYRFWLEPFIAVLCASAWFGFLRALKRIKPAYCEEGEEALGALMALIAGWPSFLIFLIAVCVAVVVVSVYQNMRLKGAVMGSVGGVFLLGGGFVFMFSDFLMKFQPFSALKV